MKPLNIFGRTITVSFVKDLENSGEYHHDTGSIKICKTKSKKQEQLTLLHEIVHAICDRSGISQAIPSELEEVLCESISNAFHENFHLRRK